MQKNLKTKIAVIVLTILLCIYGIIDLPKSAADLKANLQKNIRLGLDLRGGSHLVLQRYAMGVGMPEELPEYVARGIDMMDCVLPSRNARNGCLFTSRGRIIIKHTRYKDDPRPVDEACGCYTCRTYSRAYLRHLYQAGEISYAVLATGHNIRRYLDIMREIRHAIVLDQFPEYLKAVRTVPVEVE